jgi:hypothetical protein
MFARLEYFDPTHPEIPICVLVIPNSLHFAMHLTFLPHSSPISSCFLFTYSPCSDGRVLDDLCTLGDYSVQADSTLTLAVPLAGGKVRCAVNSLYIGNPCLTAMPGARLSRARRKGSRPDPQGRQGNGQAQEREGPRQASSAIQPAVQEHRRWSRWQEEGERVMQRAGAPLFNFVLQGPNTQAIK